jgi:hypothetical protein
MTFVMGRYSRAAIPMLLGACVACRTGSSETPVPDAAGGDGRGIPGDDDGAVDDAGLVHEAGATDGGAVDAGACPAAGTRTSYGPYAWSCGPSNYGNPWSYTNVFAGPTIVTLVENHMNANSAASTSRLYAGCDFTAPPLLTERFDTHNRAIVVDAGLYTFLACDDLGAAITDPVPYPLNANTSCATASSSFTTAYRVYDATARLYYTWSPPNAPGALFTVTVSSPFVGFAGDLLGDGTFTAEVQATCDDPTTDVIRFNGGLQNFNRAWASPKFSVSASRYFIVLSAMDPALQPKLTITDSLP